MASKWKYNSSEFICKDCGNIATMQRITAKQFPKYSTRAIWCPNCKKNVEHIELQQAALVAAEIEMNGPQDDTEKLIQKLIKKHENRSRPK